METEINDGCFACGAANPIGLGLNFDHREADSVSAVFTPLQWHQGYGGLVHGGIIATLLDEAMAHALLARKIRGVTGKLTLRFREALPVGTTVVVTGRINADRGRIIETSAEVQASGALVAAAEAVFVVQQRGD